MFLFFTELISMFYFCLRVSVSDLSKRLAKKGGFVYFSAKNTHHLIFLPINKDHKNNVGYF